MAQMDERCKEGSRMILILEDFAKVGGFKNEFH